MKEVAAETPPPIGLRELSLDRRWRINGQTAMNVRRHGRLWLSEEALDWRGRRCGYAEEEEEEEDSECY